MITYFVNPDFKVVLGEINAKSSNEISDSSGLEKVWFYIVNNGFKVPLQMFILALIPIQFLYSLNIISTAAIPGVLFGIILQENAGKGIELIIATIPHYIFEIFALCLFAAILFELNKVIRVKIRSLFKRTINKQSLIKKFSETVFTYAALVLPIIIMAAFLETFIADLLLNLFQ